MHVHCMFPNSMYLTNCSNLKVKILIIFIRKRLQTKIFKIKEYDTILYEYLKKCFCI